MRELRNSHKRESAARLMFTREPVLKTPLRSVCVRNHTGARSHSHMKQRKSVYPDILACSHFTLVGFEVKSIHKQQTTIRKPIECAPEASRGGREWAEMTEGVHLEVTRHKC